MHRAREVLQQKFDGQDVEHYVEGPAQTVVRIPRHPRRIPYRDFRDARAVETRQRRDEAMQLPVEIDLLQYLRAISLECGAEVPLRDTRAFRHEPVRDARRDLPGERVVDAVLPPAAGNVVAFLDLAEQRWNIFGGML